VAARAPYGRGSLAAGLQQPTHLGKRLDGLRNMHEPEAADGGIEAPIGEGQRLCVGALEARIGEAAVRRDAARLVDHLARDVSADNGAGRTDGRGDAQADQTGAAGDLQDAVARLQSHHVEHQVVRRLELVAPALLVRGGRAVPAVALYPTLQSGLHCSRRHAVDVQDAA
jgi:hypothetical protein